MMWFSKFKGAINEFGFTKACIYVAQRGLSHLGGGIYLYDFVAQPVQATPLLPGTRGQGIIVRQVDPQDAALKSFPLTQGVIDYRVGQNALCLGAFQNDRMIGYLWLCLGPYREDEVASKFTTAPQGLASWDFDVFLLPQFRFGLGFLRLWDEANKLLRERGIRWSVSRISAFNNHSLISHRKLGARKLASALFVRLGPLQVAFASIQPYLRVSIGACWVPEYVFHVPSGEGQSA